MQSCTAGRNAFVTGMYPLRAGMIPPQLPGSPSYLRPGTPALAKFLLDLGYNDRRVRQEPPGRSPRFAADGARLPGILGLPVSPGRHAAGELPRHQQDPDRAGRRAAGHEHADPRPPEVPGAVDPSDDALPDPAAPGALVQSPDGTAKNQMCKDEGPLTLERSKTVDEEISAQGHRLPRSQRPQEDQQAVLLLVQPGPHAHHDRTFARSTRPCSARRAARTGASTKSA